MMYNPTRMMGLSALSPAVSAEQQYIQKQKMPPDNIDPILRDLLANKQQLDNAAKAQQQMQQQPPNPPTIAQQYNAAAAQQANQLRQQLAAMAQQAQMDRGLGGIPVSNVGNEKAYARGGIVAFDEGGDVKRFAIGGLTAAEEAEYNTLQAQQDRYNQALGMGGIGAAATVTPPDTERLSQLQDKIDFYKSHPHGFAPGKYPLTPPAQPAAPAQTAASTAAPKPSAASAAPFGIKPPASVVPSNFMADMGLTPPAAAPAPVAQPTAKSGIASVLPTTKAAAPTEDEETAELRKLIAENRAEITAQEKEKPAPSAALANENQFIEDMKKRLGVEKEEARMMFWLNFGANMLGNRSPHFAVALGESLKDSSTGMMQSLRELKNEQDRVQLQAIQLQEKREEAERTGDERKRAALLNARARLADNIGRLVTHRDAINDRVQARAVQQQEFGVRMAEIKSQNDETNALKRQALEAQIARTDISSLTSRSNKLASMIASTYDPADKARYTDEKALIDSELRARRAGGTGGASNTSGGAGSLTPSLGAPNYSHLFQ